MDESLKSPTSSPRGSPDLWGHSSSSPQTAASASSFPTSGSSYTEPSLTTMFPFTASNLFPEAPGRVQAKAKELTDVVRKKMNPGAQLSTERGAEHLLHLTGSKRNQEHYLGDQNKPGRLSDRKGTASSPRDLQKDETKHETTVDGSLGDPVEQDVSRSETTEDTGTPSRSATTRQRRGTVDYTEEKTKSTKNGDVEEVEGSQKSIPVSASLTPGQWRLSDDRVESVKTEPACPKYGPPLLVVAILITAWAYNHFGKTE